MTRNTNVASARALVGRDSILGDKAGIFGATVLARRMDADTHEWRGLPLPI